MALLEAENVVKTYAGGERSVRALDGVDISVDRGEFVSIVGPSGCGKTTFLRIVDGLLEPTSGTIRLDGDPIEGSGLDRGMVFQSSKLFPWRTVAQNVAFGLEACDVTPDERDRRVKQFVELVGLDGFEDAYPDELSGGMRKRVGLARALAIDPEILLMDEPFGELDAQTREMMQVELLKIWSKQRKTCVFVTHDIEEAVFLSDRVFLLSDRPGTVKAVVDVPFERPRNGRRLKSSDDFGDVRRRVWDLLLETQRNELEKLL